jgi:hypothetical protein
MINERGYGMTNEVVYSNWGNSLTVMRLYLLESVSRRFAAWVV